MQCIVQARAYVLPIELSMFQTCAYTFLAGSLACYVNRITLPLSRGLRKDIVEYSILWPTQSTCTLSDEQLRRTDARTFTFVALLAACVCMQRLGN